MQEIIDSEPRISRAKLSRQICEELGWGSCNGRLKEVSCRTALLKLHRRGAIRLAEAAPFPVQRKDSGQLNKLLEPQQAELQAELKQLQPVELIRIDSSDRVESKVWNELMERYHYLGAGPLCGSQIRYLVRSQRYGWLGGMSFSAPAWKVKARDEWIGWSNEARQEQLNQIVNNSRFLILPYVHVPHLASHVLGLALRRLRSDWRGRYGDEPSLVETFIEARRFAGTCYRAANFTEVGQTQGRGRHDRHNQRAVAVKRVLVYAWSGQARQQLCAADAARKTSPSLQPPGDWAETEFGKAQLPDQRLRKRLLTMARDMYARPQAQIPESCQSRAKTKAAYRFLDHPETDMEVL